MLRNLNRSYTRGRVCGTPQSGVTGSLIQATGDNGAGYVYSSLSLPADNNNEYQGYITSVPAGLTLFAYEDTSFTAAANDGVYTVPFELWENGILLGTTDFTITFGSSGVTVSCAVGDGATSGLLARIDQGMTLLADVGNSSADGLTTGVAINVSITTSLGAASADGLLSAVTTAYVLSPLRMVSVARVNRYITVARENRIVSA
jgi:hypothetical protein